MKTKWKITLAGLLAVGIIVYMLFNSWQGIEVSVLEVQTGSIGTTFKEEGTVKAAVEQNFSALYGGEITDIAVEEGQSVGAGDHLLSINSQELDYQLQQLRAQLKSIEGQQRGSFLKPQEAQISNQKLLVEQAIREMEVSQTNLDRMKALHEAGAISAKDLEDAQHMASNAQNYLALQEQALSALNESASPDSGTAQYYEGQIEALLAQINMLEYQKQKTHIIADLDGVVGNIAVSKSDMVVMGTPLLTVFQPTSYELEVFILTADVGSISPGMEVDLILETKAKDHVFTGTVKSIAPAAIRKTSALGLEEQRVKVTVTWETTNGIKLLPGYQLDAEFTTDQRDNVLVIPKTAIFPHEQGEAVWLVSNGRAVIQPIQTGFETNRDIVIEAGLAAGDMIITDPQLEGLQDGKKVTIN